MPGSFQANEYQSQSICFLGRSPGRRSDHFRHLSADRPDSLCFPDFQCRIFITIVSLLIQGTTVSYMANLLNLSEKEPKQGNDFGMELPEEIKSAMSEIEVADNLLANGNRLMDLSLPDNTLVVMVKRGNNFFIPRGGTGLDIGDKLLVITDNDEELMKTYKNLGINEYMIQKNS